MTGRPTTAAFLAAVFVSGLSVHDATGSAAAGGLDKSRRNIPKIALLRPVSLVSTLRITNVRLEAAPPEAPKPSAVLKFDILNDSELRVTDIVIQVAMHEEPRVDHAARSRRVVVAPFTIRGDLTLEAGHTVNYEMLLRNLSSDCGCVANVVVLSARVLSEPS
jgi:hypothetical protein